MSRSLGAFLESLEVVRCGAFALGGAGKEQEVPGVAAGERCFEVGAADDGGHLVDAAATAWAGAGQDHAADEFGCLQRDHLGDAAAEREAEQVDLFEAHGADEGDRVGAHLLDGGRHRPAGGADTAVVEGDHAVVRGDAVDDARVPVVEDRGQVVQEHHRNA